jgi:ATP-dependent DNA ligase
MGPIKKRRYEDQVCSGRLHHPRPAGHGIKTALQPDWVHEIKHDGYWMIVHRDGPTVRVYSRNANDWTARLPGIAAAAARIKARSFTIDGEAVVLGPTAYRASMSCPVMRPLEPRSSTPST